MYGLESFGRGRIKREEQLHPDIRYSNWTKWMQYLNK